MKENLLLRDTTMHKCVQKTNLNMILKDMNSGKCPEERDRHPLEERRHGFGNK